MAYASFRQFVEALDKAGELTRISVPVETDLLISEWANREMKSPGGGKALLAENPIPLESGVMIGRAAAHPHGFVSGADGLYLLSVQIPRPLEGATTWDQPGFTTDAIDCAFGGTCRKCGRCGGHSSNVRGRLFMCENCSLEF